MSQPPSINQSSFFLLVYMLSLPIDMFSFLAEISKDLFQHLKQR